MPLTWADQQSYDVETADITCWTDPATVTYTATDSGTVTTYRYQIDGPLTPTVTYTNTTPGYLYVNFNTSTNATYTGIAYDALSNQIYQQNGQQLWQQTFGQFQWTTNQVFQAGVNVFVNPVKAKPEFARIAVRRSEKLLAMLCSREQRRTWEKLSYIDVRSPGNPLRTYRIPAYGMIEVMEGGRAVHKLCIHTKERLPAADTVATLKMLVECEEAELLRVANVHRIDGFATYTQGNQRLTVEAPRIRLGR